MDEDQCFVYVHNTYGYFPTWDNSAYFLSSVIIGIMQWFFSIKIEFLTLFMTFLTLFMELLHKTLLAISYQFCNCFTTLNLRHFNSVWWYNIHCVITDINGSTESIVRHWHFQEKKPNNRPLNKNPFQTSNPTDPMISKLENRKQAR